ncbi:hypothetical protein KL864_33255 [Mycolicibacterium goodii]|uniref:hypothetical protein n=1 Tax=Mycolicibacterium goodii TaxID=134601 RepID=UPI001BDC5E7A|nr:hypothetical protein [Mycolicibacterium goodii]MBU8820739.1 hypothetical protein [Mycolicibacterium goodii]
MAEARERAAGLRAYADQVERHGNAPHVPPEQLRELLGDVYSDYITAKETEYSERSAAYRRAAQRARAMADKLDATVDSFAAGDDEAAVNLRALID